MDLSEANSIAQTMLLCIQTFLAVGAIYLAFRGFKQWRVEALGDRRIELAIRLGNVAFEIQSAFAIARSPAGSSSERDGAVDNPNLSDKENYDNATVYAFEHRLIPVNEKINRLVEVKWETSLLFQADNEIDEAILAYRRKMQELRAKMYASVYDEHPSPQTKVEQMVIIYGNPDGDVFSKEIEAITNKLLKVAREYTQEKTGLISRVRRRP